MAGALSPAARLDCVIKPGVSVMSLPNTDLDSALAEAEARYTAANPLSRALAETAARALPGGNTRTILHYTPFPVALAGGDGCHVTDIDGHRYADYLGEYSAGLYGHNDPRLLSAIKHALEAGVTLGGPNRHEGELAALISQRIPSIERLRFCNSGTEANLFAMSAARAFTGREHVMVFDGAYHGGVFYFGQVKPPINAPFPWVIAPYNDTAGTLALIDKHASQLAAVVIEPMLGGGGCIPAELAFLKAIREACTRHGILLQFDEVMTSRLAPGGLQGALGITPDLTALGKYLGGGMTFGAFGGRADILERFNPYRAGAIAHAGTFNNNVLTMAAGLTGLRDIYTPAAAVALNASGDRLRERLQALTARHGAGVTVTGVGSMLNIHLQSGEVRRPEDLWHEGTMARRYERLKALFHLDMLASGHYLSRRGFVSLSLPMTESGHDGFVAAVDEFLTVRRNLLD